jgi:PAS domain S-box-containing protein
MIKTVTPDYVNPELQPFLLQHIEQVVQIGHWRIHVDTGEVVISDSFYAIYGLDRHSVPPGFEPFERFVHPDDLPGLLRDAARMQDGADLICIQYRIVRPDGALRYLKARITRLAVPDGGLYWVGITQDQTEELMLRRQLEERSHQAEQLGKELQERSKFAEMLIDASVDRIMAMDVHFTLTAWNRVNEEYTGLSREKVLGRNFFELFPEVKKSSASLESLNRALQGEMVTAPAQPGIYHTDKYFDVFYIPIKNNEGAVIGLLTLAHDVTASLRSQEELKGLNQSLKQKNVELERINAELASFAYVASHDLKEPLRKIQTFAERLLARDKDRLTEAGQHDLSRVVAAVRRMDSLVDDILAFSRLNTTDWPASRLDLGRVLSQALDDLEGVITRSGAVIEAGPLPVVEANASLLHQLLYQFLGNSLKFHPPGQQPKVGVQAEWTTGHATGHPEAVSEASYLVLTVRDNGIGFEQEYAEKIFQMFQRLHGRTEYGGTGIGLSICKKVAEYYQGFIKAEGNPGEGAVFRCYLQVRKGD